MADAPTVDAPTSTNPAPQAEAALATTGAAPEERPTRLVSIAFLVLTFISALILEHAVAALMTALHVNDAPILGSSTDAGSWTLSSLVGYLLAIGVAVGVWMNPRLNGLAFEVALELRRVTWPTFEETRTNTLAVVIFTFSAATVLGIFDFLSSKLMTAWIPSFLNWLVSRV
jgi:preprotein translocase subunit SecE